MCLDETSKQLIVETRAPIPTKPGQPARHDYEYERNGVADLFMMFAPLEGWRHVKVTDRHAAVDYAQALKELSDLHFPDADKIVLVQDNLSTHTTASLYTAFPAPEARRLANRLEWHYTPKHGSWLDMAESELRRSDQPMPEPTHSRQPDSGKRSRRLGAPSKQAPRQGRLAIHNRKRPGQAQEALSPIRMTRATRTVARGQLGRAYSLGRTTSSRAATGARWRWGRPMARRAPETTGIGSRAKASTQEAFRSRS